MSSVVNGTLSNDSADTNLVEASYVVISDECLWLFMWIGYTVICELIDMFGTVTNIFNIVCFVKLGFQDPINVSLLGLAFSDLICVASLIWTNICMNPAFNEADLPFEPIELQYITSGWLHTNFNRLTSCITAFITLERCLCITLPLKIKGIFTSQRVAVIIVCLYVVLLTSVAPVYVVTNLGMVFSERRNKTLLGLVYTKDRKNVEQISFAINNTVIPFMSFILIIVCTFVLVIKLRSQSKWRHLSTSPGQTSKVSTRDQKVVKMVIVISTLFIVCFVPVSVNFIAYMIIPDFFVDGKYRNMSIFFFGLGLILESTNSATNIFIYFFMSSNYRHTFKRILHIKSKSEE